MICLQLIVTLILVNDVYSLMPIGVNVDPVRDWSRSLPYVNLVRQARSWGSPEKPWDGNCTFDAKTGWPTSDFGMVIASSGVDLAGNYPLYAKGNAQISFVASVGQILNQTYDRSTNTLSAIISIPQGGSAIMLSFRNTTGPGLKDIVILQPGYNLTSKSRFTDLFIAHLSRFNILRFMDWTETNHNDEMHWNETTPHDWPQYRSPKRNSWKTIPNLLHQIDKPIDIWINIPHSATDDYILNLATLLFKELNPRHKIYLEYSNELWNRIFPQSRENFLAANESVWKDNDRFHLNFDNGWGPYAWSWRRTAFQIKRISDLFKRVFGNENVGLSKRVRPILAGQAVSPQVIINGLEYLNAVHGPPSTHLHGIAVAPYYGLGPYREWSNLTVHQVLDGLNMSVDRFLPENGWGQQGPLGVHAVFAAWYKLNVYGYEGGPDTAGGCGECSLEAKIAATRHPRMTEIALRYLNAWSRFGFQTLNWFTAGAGRVTEYGSWALMEDIRQETLVDTTKMFHPTSPVAQLPRPSPKLKAIDQYRQSSIQMNFGIPIPSYNFSATHYAGHPEPNPNPFLRNVDPKSRFYYPLKIVRSAMKINVTVYVSGDGGILEGSINDDQAIQVKTPSTPDVKTFQAAPSMQFTVAQATVPSIVTLRLRAIQPGFSIRSFDVTAI